MHFAKSDSKVEVFFSAIVKERAAIIAAVWMYE
jgi:hypothetical protein